jgi:hypothetical protein
MSEYLRTVKSNRGHAAWMAGHLLGDHWDARQSLPILLEVATKGRFSAGRRAAVLGLQDLHRRADVPKADRQRVVEAIDEISRLDRSRKVRAWTSGLSAGVEGGAGDG